MHLQLTFVIKESYLRQAILLFKSRKLLCCEFRSLVTFLFLGKTKRLTHGGHNTTRECNELLFCISMV
jgi:hypothetical protein